MDECSGAAPTPAELSRRVGLQLLRDGLLRNPLALPPEKYDQLLPSWAQKELAALCSDDAVPQQIRLAREILISVKTINLGRYKIAGDLVTTNDAFIERVQRLREALRTGTFPAGKGNLRHLVCSDPGSGKSALIREIGKEAVTEAAFIEEAGSDHSTASELAARILERVDTLTAFETNQIAVFVDEVDTVYPGGYLYEELYHMMDGARPASLPGRSIGGLNWFFAASCSASCGEFESHMHALPEATKARDFLDRIPNRLDLPRLTVSELEPVIRTAGLLRRLLKNLETVDGLVLCYVASRTFRSARDLAQIVEGSCRGLDAAARHFAWDYLRIDPEEKRTFVADYYKFLGDAAARTYRLE